MPKNITQERLLIKQAFEFGGGFVCGFSHPFAEFYVFWAPCLLQICGENRRTVDGLLSIEAQRA